MSKAKAMFPSDTISFKDVDTGHNSAGNGGDGINKGDISSKPTFIYDPTNKADGGNTYVKTGDNVHQKADWDAGGANAKAEKWSKADGGKAHSNGDQESKSGHDTSKVHASTNAYKADGGKAYSNGDQESKSGHDTSKVDASTNAYQENYVKADMSQNVYAGIGGDGGDKNNAEGGDVHFKGSIESTNLSDSLNSYDHHHIDDSGLLLHG
jgi:hypothetical protein